MRKQTLHFFVNPALLRIHTRRRRRGTTARGKRVTTQVLPDVDGGGRSGRFSIRVLIRSGHPLIGG